MLGISKLKFFTFVKSIPEKSILPNPMFPSPADGSFAAMLMRL